MRVEFGDEFYEGIERIREHILVPGGNAVARMDEIFGCKLQFARTQRSRQG